MNLKTYLTEHPPLEIEPHKLVAHLTGFSNSQARKLIEQKAVTVNRNEATVQIDTDSYFLKGDTVRIGKGRFYSLE